MNHGRLVAAAVLLAASFAPSRAEAAAPALNGSRMSMVKQHEIARTSEYAFMETPQDVRQHAEQGDLVYVPGGDHYELAHFVVFPYAISEVLLFVERLAEDYHAATGERLVVTSLVRPLTQQPPNAHKLSVHPAGMALDLRVPARASSRTWLQNALLELESKGVLDVTREYRPPHFHVAVYPAEYRAYVEAADSVRALERVAVAEASAIEPSMENTLGDNGVEGETRGGDGAHSPLALLFGSVLAGVGIVTARRRSRR